MGYDNHSLSIRIFRLAMGRLRMLVSQAAQVTVVVLEPGETPGADRRWHHCAQ